MRKPFANRLQEPATLIQRGPDEIVNRRPVPGAERRTDITVVTAPPDAAKMREMLPEGTPAKYDDKKGTPVAAVAAWNEFGTETIPERPFFRRAIAEMEGGISNIVKAGIDTKKMVVDDRLADRVGAYAQGQIQESITALKEPPNAPSTIKEKGSSSPLIDTGHMRESVTWKVEQK